MIRPKCRRDVKLVCNGHDDKRRVAWVEDLVRLSVLGDSAPDDNISTPISYLGSFELAAVAVHQSACRDGRMARIDQDVRDEEELCNGKEIDDTTITTLSKYSSNLTQQQVRASRDITIRLRLHLE